MAETSAKMLRTLETVGEESGRARRERIDRLSEAERELYRWILRTFADGRRADVEELVDTASRLDVDVETAMATLGREDLVHLIPPRARSSSPTPFSGRTTPHRVRLAGEREVSAMCAVDALGMPFMLGEEAEIVSFDPLTGEEVWVRVDPGEGVWSEPRTAVVLCGATGASGPSAATCCSFVNFFSSVENAGRYLRANPALRGQILSIPEAAETGRLIFGELLNAA